jgi:hypothetical protein
MNSEFLFKHKLSIKLREKVVNGEEITPQDFVEYSKIKLKKKRSIKKFNKNPYRYLSDKVKEIYFSIGVFKCAYNGMKNVFSLELPKIIRESDSPEAKLYYLDFKQE